MLDDTLKTQLAGYLQRLTQPVEIVASLDARPASAEMRSLLDEIAALSPLIAVRHDGNDARRPSFSISRAGHDMGIRFAAIPMGHEFTSLVLALLQAGGHPPKVESETIEQIRALDGDFAFETYMSLTCHNCPDVVQALNLMAVLNPRIRHVAIDGALFQDEVEARHIMAVPAIYLNGQPFGSGRMEIGEILAKIDTGAAARDAEKLAQKDVFDVLIVGGGPAGAAAAVYAARKGIRTGIVAERLGGQTLDTLGIENFISVLETEGPKFAAALEAHARRYDVDIMGGQRVESLTPATAGAGGSRSETRQRCRANGTHGHPVDGRTLAQRQRPGRAGVPQQGCGLLPALRRPALQGPEGRRHRRRQLRSGGGDRPRRHRRPCDADRVRGATEGRRGTGDAAEEPAERHHPHQCANHRDHRDGQKVTGLRYRDRATGSEHAVDLAGVFVQIGLVPNTEWLRGTVELSKYGEIVVDAKGATNVPGVFAAGDATTTPFKQIIIAAGDGAKAALSAFDHLIRHGTEEAAPPKAAPAMLQAA